MLTLKPFTYNMLMKKILYILLPLAFLLLACKPNPHPKHPDYSIHKPKVKYKASKKNLKKMVKKLQGRPYVWAEEGPYNFDCSGFTYYMYGSMGIEIPRVARDQAKKGKRISSQELVYGDLIFFDTEKRQRGKITHVGMYLGNGWFTHASTGKYEVVYSNLNTSKYYKKRLKVCRRYLPDLADPNSNSALLKENTKPWTNTAPKTIVEKPIVPKATMPIKSRMIVPTKGHFYVQVGSFSNSPTPSLLYKITHKGYPHRSIKFPSNGRTITKLLIGPFASKAKALDKLPEIKSTIQSDAFIAEIR
jgi:hypothetical protein